MEVSAGIVEALAVPQAGEGAYKYISDEFAASRINPAISPEDPDWQVVSSRFQELLKTPDKTIQQILSQYFTQHEARMFIPEDRPDVKELQSRNTARYEDLLKGRFRSEPQTVATKLTMMYFGLPVEPLISPIDELLAKMDPREPEGPRYDVSAPLHFLTAHDARNWGLETHQGREAISYPVPLQPQRYQELRLRGGDGSDYDEDDFIDDFLGSDDDMESEDQTVPLFGYQGCIPIVPQKWKTYVMAVRQLLSLSFLDSERHSYSLIHFDRKAKKALATIHDILPLTAESPSLHYLQKHFQGADLLSHSGCCSFFVQYRDENTPFHWEPHPEQFKADLVKIAWSQFAQDNITTHHPSSIAIRSDLKLLSYAYLPFPKPSQGEFDMDDYAVNQYDEHLRAAIEVLVGRPDGSFHHCMFRLWDTTAGSDSKDKAVFIFGGLFTPKHIWENLYPLENADGCWFMDEIAIEKDELAFILPHYFPDRKGIGVVFRSMSSEDGYAVDDGFPTAEARIRMLMRRALGAEIDKMDAVHVYPGPAALGPSVDPALRPYRIPMKADETDLPGKFSRLLQSFIDEEQEPYIVLSPAWKPEHSLLWADPDTFSQPGECTAFPPLGAPLQELRDAVHRLVELTGGDIEYRPEEHYITLSTVASIKQGETRAAPQFVVAPDTSEQEWFRIRAGIPFREMTVSITTKQDIDWESRIPRSNIWGPRYTVKRSKPIPKAIAFKEATRTDDPGTARAALPKTPTSLQELRNAKSNPFLPDNEREDVEVQRTSVDPPQEGNWPPPKTSDREKTYITQPSIFDDYDVRTWPSCQGLKIPVNGAPKEHVLRTTSNVPMLTKAVLTPSEQAKLQDALWDLRNIILARVANCPVRNCDYFYRLNHEQAFEEHFRDKHMSRSCMWCDEELFEWWSESQRDRHLREKHKDKLLKALGVTGSELPERDSNGNTSTQERPVGPIAPIADMDGLAPEPSTVEPREAGSSTTAARIPGLSSTLAPPAPEPEPEKCAFFEGCQAFVGNMSLTQKRIHLHILHGARSKPPEPSSNASLQEVREEEENKQTKTNELGEEDPIDLWLSDTPVEEEEGEEEEAGEEEDEGEQGDVEEEGEEPQTTLEVTKAKRKREARRTEPAMKALKRSARQHAGSYGDDFTPAASESDLYDEESSAQRRGRSRAEAPTPDFTPDLDLDEDNLSNDDPEETRRRRAPSPDWVLELGPGSDKFQPGEDMYCSRCLRKAPKRGDRSPNRSPLPRETEMGAHTDPVRSCKIRNGLGSARDLPNRSGWIPMADLPGQVGKIKDRFLKKYPAYDRTIYPVDPRDRYASVWRSDPNTDSNRDYWAMPWPPFEGDAPLPGWTSPDDDGASSEVPAGTKRSRVPKVRNPKDPRYRYQSDEDSADDLQPDVDDLGEKKKKKKKRRRGDTAYVPTATGGGDSESEGGGQGARVQKKAKTSPAATGADITTSITTSASYSPQPVRAQPKTKKRAKTGQSSVASSRAGSVRGGRQSRRGKSGE